MNKCAIIYSSMTGNTKLIAEKIAEFIVDSDLFDVKEAPDNFSDYELVALGYWLKRGAPDPLMTKFLPTVKNSNVILFQTHGTEVGNEHSTTAFARAAYLLGEGCNILGTFSCQGKINPALIEKRLKAGPNDPHNKFDSVERWKNAANHPNDEDFDRLKNFIDSLQKKLSIKNL